MNIPFTREEFLAVFAEYNLAVWPAPLVLAALALAAAGFALISRANGSSRVAAVLLAGLWLWAGAVYHAQFFTTLSPAGYLFGALFVAQAALVVRVAFVSGRLSFAPAWSAGGVAGAVLMVYALILYRATGLIIGHLYPASPTFGVPCPVTIFTFGLLLWARPSFPRVLLVIPTLWAAVGTVAALRLGMVEDYALPVAAALGWLFYPYGATTTVRQPSAPRVA
jgi:hypothetical protein